MTVPEGHPSTWTAQQVLGLTPEERLRLTLAWHAETERFHRPEVVADLIDPASIRTDATGAPVGARDAVRALARAQPFLVSPGPPQGADGGVHGEAVEDHPDPGVNRALRIAAGVEGPPVGPR